MPSTPSRRGSCLQHLYSSPSRARNAVAAGHVTPLRRHRSGKVTEARFAPRTLVHANKGKCAARRATVVEDAFAVDKHAHNMAIIQKVAVEYIDGPLYEAYTRLLTDVEKQKDIVTFVCFFFGIFSLMWFTFLKKNCLMLGFLCSWWGPHRSHLTCPSVGS